MSPLQVFQSSRWCLITVLCHHRGTLWQSVMILAGSRQAILWQHAKVIQYAAIASGAGDAICVRPTIEQVEGLPKISSSHSLQLSAPENDSAPSFIIVLTPAPCSCKVSSILHWFWSSQRLMKHGSVGVVLVQSSCLGE